MSPTPLRVRELLNTDREARALIAFCHAFDHNETTPHDDTK